MPLALRSSSICQPSRWVRLPHHAQRRGFRIAVLLLPLCVAMAASAQVEPATPAENSPMHHAYDEAYRDQAAGDFARADAEHMHFLALALKQMANGLANTGDYAHAAPAFEEALAFAPNDFDLLMDYAGAAFEAQDTEKSASLAQLAGDLGSKYTTNQQKAAAHRMLGRALQAFGKKREAIIQFQTAAALDEDFENYSVLGNAVLLVDGIDAAEPIFAKALARFGNTAENHMQIGRIYGLGKFSERAIEEFKTAIALDPNMPGLHYSLGAAYLISPSFGLTRAEAEFRKELELHPTDTYSFPQLGHIAILRNDFREAEIDLKHATELNPLDALNFMELGKLYAQLNRLPEAEAAFRKAIALTADPSRDHYDIARAHYRLGRILVTRGQTEEGRREIQISQNMLAKAAEQEQKINPDGQPVQKNPDEATEHNALEHTRVPTPEEAAEFKSFQDQVGPLIAGSYNNLGVHAAMAGDFPRATGYFQLAAQWNADLPGVEANWGRAAFAAHQCDQAIAPLQRALEANPSDPEMRSMLNQCHALVPAHP